MKDAWMFPVIVSHGNSHVTPDPFPSENHHHHHQGMSTAEVAETYGDRIRGAPAVVNAGRSKNRKQAWRNTGVAVRAVDPEAGLPREQKCRKGGGTPPEFDNCAAVANDNVSSGLATRENGGIGATEGGCSTVDTGGHIATNDGGSGDGGADLGQGSAIRSGSGTSPGLYRPRTSGRGVGGSLRRRFSDDQVQLPLSWLVVQPWVWKAVGCASGHVVERSGYCKSVVFLATSLPCACIRTRCG